MIISKAAYNSGRGLQEVIRRTTNGLLPSSRSRIKLQTTKHMKEVLVKYTQNSDIKSKFTSSYSGIHLSP